MQEFFPQQYTQEELQRLAQQQHAQNDPRRGGNPTNMNMPGAQIPITTQQEQISLNAMTDMRNMAGMIPGSDGLDDMMIQNERRRQSLPVQQGHLNQQYQDSMGNMYNSMDMRRGPEQMIEFGAQGELNNFQFGGQPQITPPMPQQDRRPSEQRDISAEFAEMAANMNMGSPTDYSGMQSQSMAGMVPGPQYGITQAMPTMMGGIMYPTMGMTGMNDNQPSLNPFDPSNYSFAGHPMSMGQDMMMPLGTAPMHRGASGILGEIADEDTMPVTDDPNTSHSNDSRLALSRSRTHSSQSYPTPPISTNTATHAAQPAQQYSSPPQTTLPSGMPIIGPPRPPQKSNYQGVYSSSGFDMVGALMRVAARKNPEIDIGAVDMSCAFVVCDVTLPDCPIIYVSEIFERLTGYNKHEILMQNCRFLQSPDGKVQAGVKRRYVDDNVVYALKRRIRKRREVQRTLINYRKGGQAFTNLLTMIPIPWDTDDIRYFVGFQVDLVDKPGAVSGRSASGTYAVNYSQNYLPQYIWHPPDLARTRAESGQTISREDVSAVLANYPGNFDSEYTRRVWDRLLLENSDDVIHVLSLKGLFLYVSPSSLNVLEYSAAELIGTALSSVCHPSDIVPVTRELKDASSGQAVSVVYRIRRKVSGYTWFEAHGALSVEQGKGRKCIILVGRERPVYALSVNEVEANGGIGDNEIWSKLSTSGMFLFVSSHVRGILDRQAEDLQGTSIQALMRQESKAEFGRQLERARTGKTVTYKHDIMTKRGMFMIAQTTLYPGDAQEGSKPTFFIAQTRLVGKPPRIKITPSKYDAMASQSALTYHGQGDGSDGKPNSKSDSAFSSTSTLDRPHVITIPGSSGLPLGTQDLLLSSPHNIFLELQTTRCTSWQFELRQMEKANRALAEELAGLLSAKKKRKRRKGVGGVVRSCANCRVRETPEWRRGPSGMRDLCNSCGLRWAKQVSRQGGAQGKDRGGVVGGVSSEGSSSGSGGVVQGQQGQGQGSTGTARVLPVSQEG